MYNIHVENNHNAEIFSAGFGFTLKEFDFYFQTPGPGEIKFRRAHF